jgi:alpha-glucoside transport system permease protein
VTADTAPPEAAVPVLGEVTVLDDVGPARRGRTYPSAGTASVLLLPAAAVLGVLVLWPVVRTIIASFSDGDRFVGLVHYHEALSAAGVWAVAGRTLLWALVVPGVVTALGYLLAAMSRRSLTGRVTGIVLVAPIAVPLVVTGVAFRFLYHPDPGRGPATAVANVLGLDPLFLGPRLITFSLMSAFVWAWVGLAVVAFRAALAAVPPNLADAVRAHGGGRRDAWRDGQWRPLLRRTTAVVFALVALGTVRTFDLILIMAPGSVLDEASVLAVRVWQTSGTTTSGPGAALGVLWLAAVAVGVMIAALGIRQPWPPPPPGRQAPRPVPRRAWRVARRIVLPLAAALWILPLVTLVAYALHRPATADTRAWWQGPLGLDSLPVGSFPPMRNAATGAWFADPLWGSLMFTLVLSVTVTVATLALAALAAHPLAWLGGVPGQAAGVLLLAAAVVPIQVIAGPVNEVLGLVGLAGSAPGLALVHVALGLPFAVLVLRNALADLPPDQLRRERAGGGEVAALWHLRKALRPALLAVCVLEFVQVWNDLVVGLLFAGAEVPAGVLLYGQARQFVGGSGELAASALVISALPVVLMAVALARGRLIAGLVSGGAR